jgi:hypothetical protein
VFVGCAVGAGVGSGSGATVGPRAGGLHRLAGGAGSAGVALVPERVGHRLPARQSPSPSTTKCRICTGTRDPDNLKFGFSMFALCPGEPFQRSNASCALSIPAARFSPFQVLYV